VDQESRAIFPCHRYALRFRRSPLIANTKTQSAERRNATRES